MKNGCGRMSGYICSLLSGCVFVSACLCKHTWPYLQLAQHVSMSGIFMKSFKKSTYCITLYTHLPTHISQKGKKDLCQYSIPQWRASVSSSPENRPLGELGRDKHSLNIIGEGIGKSSYFLNRIFKILLFQLFFYLTSSGFGYYKYRSLKKEVVSAGQI